MSREEFAELVQLMRDTQKEYFKTRNKGVLAKSIMLEKQVDEQITLILKPIKKTPNPGFIW